MTQQGKSQRQITHELGINRETVRQYIAAGAPPHKVSHSRTKPSILAPYYPYMGQLWQKAVPTQLSFGEKSKLKVIKEVGK